MREPTTGFTGRAIGASARSLLARPAATHAGVAAVLLLGVALLAGGVRVLPLFLAGQVPPRIAPVIGRGILLVGVETAFFVAPGIGWALAAARLVERGEARALFAIGVRPGRIVAGAWAAAIAAAGLGVIAAAAWGTQAAAPGRALQAWIDEGRVACATASAPEVVMVPLLDAAWICLRGQPPRFVGSSAKGAAFGASRVRISDDLRALDVDDLEIVLESADTSNESFLAHVQHASVRGLPPLARASNLGPASRGLLLGISAAVMASLAASLVLAASVRTTGRALVIGATAPAVALLTFAALERGPSAGVFYIAVPLSGVFALALLWAVLRGLGYAASR